MSNHSANAFSGDFMVRSQQLWRVQNRLANRVLSASFLGALVILSSILVELGRNEVKRPLRVAPAAVAPVEAEIFEKPLPPAHLTQERPILHKSAPQHEQVLSKTPGVGKTSTAAPAAAEQENQVAQGAPQVVSHGPIVVSAPSPKLPSYLKNQNLKTSVLIEFVVSADGHAVPHLVGSSGNEELDATALRAAHDWRFEAAVQENHPVSSQVRLRINFQVD